MKIAVATVHDSSNFGSFLQAYALQTVLQSLGHDVYFIRTRDKQYLKRMYYPSRRLLLSEPFKYISQYKYGNKKRSVFLKDRKCFKEIDFEQADNMDLVILGSDEIWNVKTPVFTLPVFYGINLKVPVVSYAVSAGDAEYGDIVKHQTIVEAIKQMKVILARDLRTIEICEKLTGKTPEIVCDPTLLIDSEHFVREASDIPAVSGDYIAIYAYDHMIANKTFGIIRSYAEKNKLKIVSVGFFRDYADENILCGPLDFFRVLSNAKYIITSTFHGTIFSILAKKKFISIEYSIKTKDLLNRLGLEERWLPENDITDSVIQSMFDESCTINYTDVEEKIKSLRERSMSLLTDALNLGSVNEIMVI